MSQAFSGILCLPYLRQNLAGFGSGWWWLRTILLVVFILACVRFHPGNPAYMLASLCLIVGATISVRFMLEAKSRLLVTLPIRQRALQRGRWAIATLSLPLLALVCGLLALPFADALSLKPVLTCFVLMHGLCAAGMLLSYLCFSQGHVSPILIGVIVGIFLSISQAAERLGANWIESHLFLLAGVTPLVSILAYRIAPWMERNMAMRRQTLGSETKPWPGPTASSEISAVPLIPWQLAAWRGFEIGLIYATLAILAYVSMRSFFPETRYSDFLRLQLTGALIFCGAIGWCWCRQPPELSRAYRTLPLTRAELAARLTGSAAAMAVGWTIPCLALVLVEPSLTLLAFGLFVAVVAWVAYLLGHTLAFAAGGCFFMGALGLVVWISMMLIYIGSWAPGSPESLLRAIILALIALPISHTLLWKSVLSGYPGSDRA